MGFSDFITACGEILTPYEQFYVVFTIFVRLLAYTDLIRNWSYFMKTQKAFPPYLSFARFLVFFTASSHYLSILYVVYPVIFGEKAPASFAGFCFGVLCG